MVLALLSALAFYLLSRRTRAESRRIQRESEELRVLNRRLSAEIGARKRVEKDLKEAEQSLEQASKLAALGQMSAAVSHELNQPLAAMKTYLAGARLLAHPPPARGGALLLPAHRRPHRPHGRHHPPAQVLRAQGRRRHRAGRPARQRALGAVDDGAAARQDVGQDRHHAPVRAGGGAGRSAPDRADHRQPPAQRARRRARARRPGDQDPAGRGRDHPAFDRGQRPGTARARQALRALLHHQETRPGPGPRPRHLRRLRGRARRAPRRPQRARTAAPSSSWCCRAAGDKRRPQSEHDAEFEQHKIQGRDHRRRGRHARERGAVAAALGLRADLLRRGGAGAQGDRPRLPGRRHQRHPHARHGRHGAAAGGCSRSTPACR